jgi:hypothetical protein
LTFFYPLVEPGAKVDGFADLKGTYMIPRPQNTEICVSHNGNILPVKDRYLQVRRSIRAATRSMTSPT